MRVWIRDAIFFHPLPCSSSPWRKRRCSSAVHRPVFSEVGESMEGGDLRWVRGTEMVGGRWMRLLPAAVGGALDTMGGPGGMDFTSFGGGWDMTVGRGVTTGGCQ